MAQPIKTAIIGVGRWGKNVARELASASDLVAYASQSSPDNETWAQENVPHAKKQGVGEISSESDINAVAVATPISTHADIVETFLTVGKHVLCEKPLAETASQARALVALAEKQNRILMTGYVFIYHPVYQEMKRLLAGKTLKRVECIWKKYGTFTEWIEMNLLTHHLSLACDLLGKPESASVTKREGGETKCDRVEVTLSYKDCEFTSKIDRLSKEKVHTVTITLEDDTTFTWDDTKLYKGKEVIFESTETALAEEIRVFLDAVRGGDTPPTAGDFGVCVLDIHEMLRDR